MGLDCKLAMLTHVSNAESTCDGGLAPVTLITESTAGANPSGKNLTLSKPGGNVTHW